MIDTAWFNRPAMREYTAEQKLIVTYLWFTVDHAGFWVPEVDVMNTRLRTSITEADLLKMLHGRVRVMSNGEWWFSDFVPELYGPLQPAGVIDKRGSNIHQSVVRRLIDMRVPRVASLIDPVFLNDRMKEILSPSSMGSGTHGHGFGRPKEKERDKEKERRIGGAGGKVIKLKGKKFGHGHSTQPQPRKATPRTLTQRIEGGGY